MAAAILLSRAVYVLFERPAMKFFRSSRIVSSTKTHAVSGATTVTTEASTSGSIK
jgi:hypothetical protein